MNWEEIYGSSLSIENLETLEDLRIFVKTEALKCKKPLKESVQRIDEIIRKFDLSDTEKNYVKKDLLSEEQSNIKTIINSTKAKEILLKRNK